MITQTQIQELFYYKDGVLYWKCPTNRAIKPGALAGKTHANGYVQTCIYKKFYYNHRLIWLLHHGELPQCIDHIDGNPSNNRIENLRIATLSQNQYNSKMKKSNSSGIKGVSWDKSTNKWYSQIQVAKKKINLGRYDDVKLAELAVIEARKKYHGNFAKHE